MLNSVAAPRRRTRRRLIVAGIIAAAAIGVAVGVLVWLREWPVHHFMVVQEGVLYRGAQPGERGLNCIVDRYGIKTVVNLRGSEEGDWRRMERDICRRRGVNLIDVSISSVATARSGLRHFMSVATDKARYPIYVHCEMGSARTGFAVAAWRIVQQGWSYERALEEARGLRFEPNKYASNQEYDKILRELAAGADWRQFPASASEPAASTASAPATQDHDENPDH